MPRPARPNYITTREAAKQLGVSGYTVREWVRLKVVKAVKPKPTGHQQARWLISQTSVRRLKKARSGITRGQA